MTTTSNDVKFILNIQNGSRPGLSDKDRKERERERRKKPEGMNRELFNLLGGAPPTQSAGQSAGPIQGNLKEPRPGLREGVKWVVVPFINPARSDGLKLVHWQRESEIDQSYPYAKLNKKVEVLKYKDDSEYEKCAKEKDWTRQDSDLLWDLCERFDLRFVVITDQFNMIATRKRTVEELRERYFSVAKKVLELRGDTEHPIVKKPYNYDYEVRRKANLEKLFLRTAEHQNIEKQLLETLKMLEQRIKKEEKELRTLRKQTKKEERHKDGKHKGHIEPAAVAVDAAAATATVVVSQAPSDLTPLPTEEAKPATAENKHDPPRSGLIITPVAAESASMEDDGQVKEEHNEEHKEGEEESDEDAGRGGRRDRGSNVYLRSELLHSPLPITEKTKKKMDQVLKELSVVPEDLMPTAAVIKLYDSLRQEILVLLGLEKETRKKEREKRALDQQLVEREKGKTSPKSAVPEPSGQAEKKPGEGEDSKVSEEKRAPPPPDSIAAHLARPRKQIYSNLGKKMMKQHHRHSQQDLDKDQEKADAKAPEEPAAETPAAQGTSSENNESNIVRMVMSPKPAEGEDASKPAENEKAESKPRKEVCIQLGAPVTMTETEPEAAGKTKDKKHNKKEKSEKKSKKKLSHKRKDSEDKPKQKENVEEVKAEPVPVSAPAPAPDDINGGNNNKKAESEERKDSLPQKSESAVPAEKAAKTKREKPEKPTKKKAKKKASTKAAKKAKKPKLEPESAPAAVESAPVAASVAPEPGSTPAPVPIPEPQQSQKQQS